MNPGPASFVALILGAVLLLVGIAHMMSGQPVVTADHPATPPATTGSGPSAAP
jgi:hypothetical protein